MILILVLIFIIQNNAQQYVSKIIMSNEVYASTEITLLKQINNMLIWL